VLRYKEELPVLLTDWCRNTSVGYFTLNERALIKILPINLDEEFL